MSLLNLRVGLLLAALLAVATATHASTGPPTDSIWIEGLRNSPILEMPEPPETPNDLDEPEAPTVDVPEPQVYTQEVSKTGEQAEDRAGSAVASASREVDAVERLLRDHVIDPAGSALREAQDSLPALDNGADRSDADDETPAPMGADLSAQWPSFSTPVLIAAGAAASFGVLFWLLGNSASVGAGAAGTALAGRDARRFLPFASPLFTRFEKDTVLGHPKREAIYGQIVEKPGLTLQDLCEGSGLSRTAVTHHLRLLEQQHLVVSKRVGRSRHFFENGGRYGRDQKDAYAVLHNDRSKDICDYIQANPGAIQKDLCEAMEIQASVAHWHVKRLVEAQLIESVRQGRTVSYFPAAQMPAAPNFA